MPLETATYIDGLNISYPSGSDLVSAGDDHIRLIKSAIKNSFPNIAGAMTATHAELSHLAGVTANVQAQLNARAPLSHTHTEAEIQDGGVFPRLLATEVIPGSWNFTTRPQVNGNGVLDSASSLSEANIADGSILARVGSNETITGSWNFTGGLLASGLGVFRWNTTGLTSARVTLQAGGSPPGTGTAGDIVLIY